MRKSDRWGEMQTDAPVSIIMFERSIVPERQRGYSMDEMRTLFTRLEITPSLNSLAKVGRYDIDIVFMISDGS